MKQLLIVLIALLSCTQMVKAEVISSNDEMSWRIIREDLFSGKNAHVYRYKEDIRLQVIGSNEITDSLFFTDLVAELNSLLQTVEVELVAEDGNLIIDFEKDNGAFSRQGFSSWSSTISNCYVYPMRYDYYDKVQMETFVTYMIVRNLTRVFDTEIRRNINSSGDIIFSSASPINSHFDAIDKDVLSKIYAANFEDQLRASTIDYKGIVYYWHMKYSYWFSNLTIALAIILIVASFLYFLSSDSKRSSSPRLWVYIKERYRLVVGITLAYLLIHIYLSISFISNDSYLGIYLLGFYVGGFVLASLYCVMTYYVEVFFVKKVKGFVGQQLYQLAHKMSIKSI